MKIKRECATCGIDDNDVLHKHHVRDEKGEAMGLVLLCANCHNKVHRSDGTVDDSRLREVSFFAQIVADMNYEENESDIEKLELLHEILENYPSPIKIDNPNSFLWLKLNIGGELGKLKNRKENADGGGTLLHPY